MVGHCRVVEIRRIPYNILVGGFGVLCLILLFVFISLSGEVRQAKTSLSRSCLCSLHLRSISYTLLGGTAQLTLRLLGRIPRWLTEEPEIGPVLWVLGTAFSLVVVALPTVLWGGILIWNGPANYHVASRAMVGNYELSTAARAGKNSPSNQTAISIKNCGRGGKRLAQQRPLVSREGCGRKHYNSIEWLAASLKGLPHSRQAAQGECFLFSSAAPETRNDPDRVPLRHAMNHDYQQIK